MSIETDDEIKVNRPDRIKKNKKRTCLSPSKEMPPWKQQKIFTNNKNLEIEIDEM